MLWLQLAFVLLLIFLNGFFALAEMAVISSRTARLQHAAELGRAGARLALELKRDPGRFLSTVQVGITVIGVLASVFGGATLAETIARGLAAVPGWGAYSDSISFALVVIIISYLTLIFGELVPKRIALGRPEPIAQRLSGFLRLLARIVGPVEWLLSASSNVVLRLIPMRTGEPPPVTEEEITLMLRDATAAGHFEAAETAIVQMALRMGDRRVGGMMTPRTKVEWLDLTDAEEENRRKIHDSDYSRFPVVEGDSHQVIGVVQVKDLLSQMLGGRPFDIKGVVRPAFYLPDTVTALRALRAVQAAGRGDGARGRRIWRLRRRADLTRHAAIAGRRYRRARREGGPAVVRREDGSWIVEGMLPIDEVMDLTGLRDLAGAESGDFHTLGGFMMARVNRVPAVATGSMSADFRLRGR